MPEPTIADKLRQFYYSTETGLASKRRFLEMMRKKGYKRKDVLAFLNKQEAEQVFRKAKRNAKVSYYPIWSKHDGAFQLDLMFHPQAKKINHGKYIILSAIEITSRLGFCVMLRNKREESVIEALTELERRVKARGLAIRVLESDMGSEFISGSMKRWCEKRAVKHYIADEGDHHKQGMVERFNRSIKALIARYCVVNKTRRYDNVLSKLVANYNGRTHSSIKCSPNEAATSAKIRREIRQRAIERTESVRKAHGFKVGDWVRYRLRKTLFEKEGVVWSSTIHQIESHNEAQTSFKLKGVERRQKHYDLAKVPAPKAELNPYERKVDGFDLEQHLDKVRKIPRGKQTSDEPRAIPLRERTDKPAPKKKPKARKNVVKHPAGTFGYVKNTDFDLRIKSSVALATRENPLFYVARVKDDLGTDALLDYYEERKGDRKYVLKPSNWRESWSKFKPFTQPPSLGKDGKLKLAEEDYKRLHLA